MRMIQKNNNPEENSNDKSFLDKNKWVLPVLMGVFGAIICRIFYMFWNTFGDSELSNNIADWGAFGDFFAATFAPFVNILAAILVYKSFRIQYEANKTQSLALQREIERSNNFRRSDFLMHDIDSFEKHIESCLDINRDFKAGFIYNHFGDLSNTTDFEIGNYNKKANDKIRKDPNFNRIVALCERYDYILNSIRDLPDHMIVERRVLRTKLREMSKVLLIGSLENFIITCKQQGSITKLDEDNLIKFNKIEMIISYFPSSEFKD